MAEPMDPRLTPARPDLAADFLRGRVKAERFASAQPMRISAFQAPLYGRPDVASPWQSELLLGEDFDVYEMKNGWAWGQAKRDGFVGYVPADALSPAGPAPDMHITALRTPVFAAPDLKAPILGFAHLLSRFASAAEHERYRQISPGGGWVFAGHCVPLPEHGPDWVEAALLYEQAPYVWGGRSSYGLDCSALVQNALQAGGIKAPRDSDMQEAALGAALDLDSGLQGLQRGDLVFWRGHVGLMLDAGTLLHANAFHMRVAREPLALAVARIQKTTGPVTTIRRLG